jgi:hypothetical protein
MGKTGKIRNRGAKRKRPMAGKDALTMRTIPLIESFSER